MKPIIVIICLTRLVFGYNITFSARNYFSNNSVANPYTNILRNESNTLLICYEENFAEGNCKLGSIDIANQQISFSPVFQFDLLAAQNYEIQLFDSNNFLMAYLNSNDTNVGGSGKLVIGSMDISTSDMILKYGDKVIFNANNTHQNELIELTQTKSIFVVCYIYGYKYERNLDCKLGEYSTNTLAVQFSANIYGAVTNKSIPNMGIAQINNHTFLVCYTIFNYTVDNEYWGQCKIGSINNIQTSGINAEITFNKEVIFDRYAAGNIQILNISSTDFIVCYSRYGSNPSCAYGVIKNNINGQYSVLFESINQFPDFGGAWQAASFAYIPQNAQNINNIYPLLVSCSVCVNDAVNRGKCIFGEIDVKKKQIGFLHEISIFNEPANFERINTLYLNANNMLVCYVNEVHGVNTNGSCIVGTINDIP